MATKIAVVVEVVAEDGEIEDVVEGAEDVIVEVDTMTHRR